MSKQIYVVLDNIRSRENVGSIFRTSDAVGVSKIYLCGITPTPSVGNPKSEIRNPKQIPNSKYQIQNQDKIAKTALGAEKWIPWEHHNQTWRLLKKLKIKKLKIIALEQTRKSTNIFKFSTSGGSAAGGKIKFPLVLVVGNEVKGLSPKILKYCDKKVFIPMYGKKESLNVAVAAGIAIYQIQNSNFKF